MSKFRVWAPLAEEASVHIVAPFDCWAAMRKDEKGYWTAQVPQAGAGTRYFYRLDRGPERPDPQSAFQPEGVFGPSQIVDHAAFQWRDQSWKGVALPEMIIYELHVGAFTPEGTFAAVEDKLAYLLELGVNAIELMPVAQFSGRRNWGYDGVFPFAVQNSYGGPDGLKSLVDQCHRWGMSVILDVVYNHLGPEGNFLGEFMPCMTERYQTPWGRAINFDDAYSEGVREFFLGNALHWFEHYHVDALRLDAVHGIFDMSAEHILKEMAGRVHQLGQDKGRPLYLIAESNLNDVRIITPAHEGGHGMDAQWSDDFHHSLHTLLTGERSGYYADFGTIGHLVKAYEQGFVYAWDFSSFRKRRHGSRLNGPVDPAQLIVFMQNHDQVGNRLKGERLTGLVSFEALKLAAAAYILSPFVPMLFMGEEHGQEAPFLYFMDFQDEQLVRSVRQGRQKEFADFSWDEEPADPYGLETFERSRIRWEQLESLRNKVLFEFYKRTIELRKKTRGTAHMQLILNFDGTPQELALQPQEGWALLLDSSDPQWLGQGKGAPKDLSRAGAITLAPLSCLVYGPTP